MTRYVLLREHDDGLWATAPPGEDVPGEAVFEARSADAALREAPSDGVWVAVPLRRWRPTLVETETRPVRSLVARGPGKPGAG